MKITLIQCPLWGTFDPPVALAQLSSCLKEKGHQVRVFDLNIKLYIKRSAGYANIWAWEQSDFWYKPELVNEYCVKNASDVNYYIEQVLKDDVKLIGFSVNIASLHMSLEFAKKIKSKNKNVKIVFGGPLFLNKKYINEITSNESVDVIIFGEGEDTICKLAQAVSENEDFADIPGIAFKNASSITINSPTAPVNLDSLPFSDFEDLPFTDYDNSEHIPFMASRGCIQRCLFCSDAPCWPGYRAMSGQRIFQEVAYQKNLNMKIGHIDFLDLEFNGNMNSLISFCELMKANHLDIHWNANMIVRPEMSLEVIKKMALAGCEHVIFGIESGSERILKLMNKHYNMADADRIIRQMHEAGICVTANFMFGFPGETEEDFLKTLDFLKRNAKYLDRCYPSRTYFALEEFSYVYSHLEEFDIKPRPYNHLFWESVDGKNTYPLRMDQCRRFCELALELGIEVGKGVQTSVLQDEQFNLAHYYETKKDYSNAVKNLLNYYNIDNESAIVNNKLLYYKQQCDSGTLIIEEDTIVELNQAIKNIKILSQDNNHKSCIVRLKPEISRVFLKNKIRSYKKVVEDIDYDKGSKDVLYMIIDDIVKTITGLQDNSFQDVSEEYNSLMALMREKNSKLNDKEFNDKEIVLKSSPKAIFLQFAGPCNSSCVFCSRGRDYSYFDLSGFKERIESKIAPNLALAEQFILTGSGEFLRLSEWRVILEYFEKRYPCAEKMFSTNASSLRPEVIDVITGHKGRYAIHASLHASNPSIHKIMTRMDNFTMIIEQIKYLIEKRKRNNNIRLDLFFVATTLNIDDLPNFVRLAKELGANSVIVNYNYIYVPAQKYLSCYFKPELTNKMFDEASQIASDLDIKLCLPPKFNNGKYYDLGICRELWSQIMLSEDGRVLPCDASHDCNLHLERNKKFYDIWNSEYYVKMRKELVESGKTKCFEHCYRANPSSVNLFSSHVIHRGRENQKIDEFWEDNF